LVCAYTFTARLRSHVTFTTCCVGSFYVRGLRLRFRYGSPRLPTRCPHLYVLRFGSFTTFGCTFTTHVGSVTVRISRFAVACRTFILRLPLCYAHLGWFVTAHTTRCVVLPGSTHGYTALRTGCTFCGYAVPPRYRLPSLRSTHVLISTLHCLVCVCSGSHRTLPRVAHAHPVPATLPFRLLSRIHFAVPSLHHTTTRGCSSLPFYACTRATYTGLYVTCVHTYTLPHRLVLRVHLYTFTTFYALRFFPTYVHVLRFGLPAGLRAPRCYVHYRTAYFRFHYWVCVRVCALPAPRRYYLRAVLLHTPAVFLHFLVTVGWVTVPVLALRLQLPHARTARTFGFTPRTRLPSHVAPCARLPGWFTVTTAAVVCRLVALVFCGCVRTARWLHCTFTCTSYSLPAGLRRGSRFTATRLPHARYARLYTHALQHAPHGCTHLSPFPTTPFVWFVTVPHRFSSLALRVACHCYGYLLVAVLGSCSRTVAYRCRLLPAWVLPRLPAPVTHFVFAFGLRYVRIWFPVSVPTVHRCLVHRLRLRSPPLQFGYTRRSLRLRSWLVTRSRTAFTTCGCVCRLHLPLRTTLRCRRTRSTAAAFPAPPHRFRHTLPTLRFLPLHLLLPRSPVLPFYRSVGLPRLVTRFLRLPLRMDRCWLLVVDVLVGSRLHYVHAVPHTPCGLAPHLFGLVAPTFLPRVGWFHYRTGFSCYAHALPLRAHSLPTSPLVLHALYTGSFFHYILLFTCAAHRHRCCVRLRFGSHMVRFVHLRVHTCRLPLHWFWVTCACHLCSSTHNTVGSAVLVTVIHWFAHTRFLPVCAYARTAHTHAYHAAVSAYTVYPTPHTVDSTPDLCGCRFPALPRLGCLPLPHRVLYRAVAQHVLHVCAPRSTLPFTHVRSTCVVYRILRSGCPTGSVLPVTRYGYLHTPFVAFWVTFTFTFAGSRSAWFWVHAHHVHLDYVHAHRFVLLLPVTQRVYRFASSRVCCSSRSATRSRFTTCLPAGSWVAPTFMVLGSGSWFCGSYGFWFCVHGCGSATRTHRLGCGSVPGCAYTPFLPHHTPLPFPHFIPGHCRSCRICCGLQFATYTTYLPGCSSHTTATHTTVYLDFSSPHTTRSAVRVVIPTHIVWITRFYTISFGYWILPFTHYVAAHSLVYYFYTTPHTAYTLRILGLYTFCTPHFVLCWILVWSGFWIALPATLHLWLPPCTHTCVAHCRAVYCCGSTACVATGLVAGCALLHCAWFSGYGFTCCGSVHFLVHGFSPVCGYLVLHGCALRYTRVTPPAAYLRSRFTGLRIGSGLDAYMLRTRTLHTHTHLAISTTFCPTFPCPHTHLHTHTTTPHTFPFPPGWFTGLGSVRGWVAFPCLAVRQFYSSRAYTVRGLLLCTCLPLPLVVVTFTAVRLPHARYAVTRSTWVLLLYVLH